MTEAAFWKILNRAAERSVGDEELAIEFVQASLEQLSQPDLVAYARHLERFRDQLLSQRLYGVLFLANGTWDDESAMDLAAWIVLQGQEVFEKARDDLDSLAAILSPDRDDYGQVIGEIFAYQPYEVHQDLHGKDLPFATEEAGKSIRPDAFDEEIALEDPAQMQSLFPKIWAKLGGYPEKCFVAPEYEKGKTPGKDDPEFKEFLDSLIDKDKQGES